MINIYKYMNIYNYIIFIILIIIIIFFYKYESKHNTKKSNSSFIKNLFWRRSEKHFIPGNVDIINIKSAILNAPSAYGIQPFHVIVITNPDIKKKLEAACYYQSQIQECYCLFIFCAIRNIEDRIDEYVNKTGFYNKKASIINYVNNLYSKIEWAKRQAYIALAFGMAAAMEMNIATCPIESFIPEEIIKILELENNLEPCVLLAVGIKKDDYELEKRFRFDNQNIFSLI